MDQQPRRYLLAVGISNYDEWPNLDGVPEEVDHIVSLLCNPPYGFQRILPEASTAPHTERLLTQLAKWTAAQERLPLDQLIIYWTGHGEVKDEELILSCRILAEDRLLKLFVPKI